MSLSPALVARQRALAEATFSDSFAVLRVVDDGTVTVDPDGSPIPPAEGVVASGTCRLQRVQVNSAEKVIADALRLQRPYVVLLPVGTDCTPSDRLRVGAVRTFEIRNVVEPGAAAAHWIAVVDETS
jgi:hypothetical protein